MSGGTNPLNRRSQGVLPVALLGTVNLDVSLVDVSSVVIARVDGVGGSAVPQQGPPGPRPVLADVGTPLDDSPCSCHDSAGDGILDLAMKFRTADVVANLQLSDLASGDLVELVLSGKLLDGTPFCSVRLHLARADGRSQRGRRRWSSRSWPVSILPQRARRPACARLHRRRFQQGWQRGPDRLRRSPALLQRRGGTG